MIAAIRCAHVAIESDVRTCELSTGGDWSISRENGSTVLPASIANAVRPVDDAGQFGPQPADRLGRFVDDGVQVVLRDRLQRPVGGVEQASDVDGNLRLADRDDIAVAQRRAVVRRPEAVSVR